MKKYFSLIVFLIFILNTPCCAKNAETPAIYKKAKQELNPHYYQVYRLTEQIIKANRLDEHAWRINLVGVENRRGNYDFNAETSNANLITIYPGMLDTFSGDLSAFAYIISHEMAHQLLDHLKKRAYMKEQTNNKIKMLEAKGKNLEKEGKNIAHRTNSSRTSSYGLWGLVETTADVYGTLRGDSKIKNINNEITKISGQIKQERRNYFNFIQNQEYQADDLGLFLLLRAGFKPDGAIRAFSFLRRLPKVYDPEGTHPPIESRLQAVQNRLKTIDIKKLKAEGKQNLDNSIILSYDYSLDGKSLKINSKYSSNKNVDQVLDHLFTDK